MKTTMLDPEYLKEVRSYIDHDFKNLRFDIYDLGALLLRNDKDGLRLKKWKDEVADWSREAVRLSEGQWVSDEPTPKNLSEVIQHTYDAFESWVMVLGKAVFDVDQHEYFRLKMNHLLVESQTSLTRQLRGIIFHSKPVAAQVDALNSIAWTQSCATENGGYHFQVLEIAPTP